jgi:GTPase SAR1 family protein
MFRLDKSVSDSHCPAESVDEIGYKSLAPIYFRNSNAAVIVYDITQVSLVLVLV